MVPRPRVVLLRDEQPVADLLEAMRELRPLPLPGARRRRTTWSASPACASCCASGLADGPAIGDITRPPPAGPRLAAAARRAGADARRQATTSPASSTSTAGWPAWSPSRTSPRSWWASSSTRTTPSPPASSRAATAPGTCPGTLRLDEVERATGVSLPESDDYETIAGLVLAVLGRMAGARRRRDGRPSLPDDGPVRGRTTRPSSGRARPSCRVHRRVPEWVRLAPAVPGDAVPQTRKRTNRR